MDTSNQPQSAYQALAQVHSREAALAENEAVRREANERGVPIGQVLGEHNQRRLAEHYAMVQRTNALAGERPFQRAAREAREAREAEAAQERERAQLAATRLARWAEYVEAHPFRTNIHGERSARDPENPPDWFD